MATNMRHEFQRAIELHQAGRWSQAEQIYRQLLAVAPGHAGATQQLGVIALQTGRHSEGADLIARAISMDGTNADWHVNLGAAYNALNRPADAIAAFRAAIELKPESGVAQSNLAAVLKDVDLDEAITVGRRAVELSPSDPIAHSNLLLSLNYRISDAQAILAEHRKWAEKFSDPLRRLHRPHTNRRDPDRPLRIGYISADFRDHAMSHFLLPLLGAHDPKQFQVVCFDDTRRPDAVTAQLKTLAGRWVSTLGRDHQQVTEIVRGEGIDILIDVAGHFAGNRLLVFARRPAPVQVSCIGYPCTTGLGAIDYRLTDSVCDPPGAEADSSEALVRLPDIFWCFQPPHDAPDVAELPAAQRGGAITFGSANVFAKITREALDLWGRILAQTPDSSIVLQGTAFAMDCPRQFVCDALAAHGIATRRVRFLDRQTMREHLQTIAQFDIALDTFPFNGGTTTCLALWMGIPVVTLAGQRHASRMGASILRSIGMQELIADDSEQYVESAVNLARDVDRLRRMRRELRDRMSGSPLMNARRFTENMERELRAMWQKWCSSPDQH